MLHNEVTFNFKYIFPTHVKLNPKKFQKKLLIILLILNDFAENFEMIIIIIFIRH